LYANYSKSNAWKGMPSATQYQIGWNKNWGQVQLGLAAIRTYSNDRQDDRLTVSVSLPLGASTSAPTAHVSVNSGNMVATSSQASVYGTLGEQQEYGYGVSASNGPQGNTSGLSGSYTGDKVTLRASLGQGSTYTQYSLSASGGLVVHRGGVTASQTLGDTVAIVEAEGAEGATLRYQNRVSINSRDFAVIPYLEPYALNAIEIDSSNLGFDTRLKNSTEKVVPRAGTVSYVKFETEKSYFLVIQLGTDKATRLPFGGTVTDATGQVVGSISQGGKLQAHVSEASGVLYVDIEASQNEFCEIDFKIPADANKAQIHRLTGECRRVTRPNSPGTPSQQDAAPLQGDTPEDAARRGQLSHNTVKGEPSAPRFE
jgi:outer membrane usher protein